MAHFNPTESFMVQQAKNLFKYEIKPDDNMNKYV